MWTRGTQGQAGARRVAEAGQWAPGARLWWGPVKWGARPAQGKHPAEPMPHTGVTVGADAGNRMPHLRVHVRDERSGVRSRGCEEQGTGNQAQGGTVKRDGAECGRDRAAGKDGAHTAAGAGGDAAGEEGNLPGGMRCAMLGNRLGSRLGEAAAGGEAPVAPGDRDGLWCASTHLQETSPVACEWEEVKRGRSCLCVKAAGP